MFDGFDAMPLCVAPLIGVLWTVLAFVAIKRYLEKTNSPRSVSLVLPFALFVVFWFVCGLSFLLQIGTAVPSPWVKPFAWDVMGQWGLSTCTAKRFGEQWDHFSGAWGTIDFKYDGSFSVDNLPAFWKYSSLSEKRDGEYISGSGTWYVLSSMGRIQNREWRLYAKFNRINGVADNRVLEFYFNGQMPPYDLAYSNNINSIILTKRPFSFGDGFCP